MEDALRERAAEIARADRAKDDFLAMLAHEMRNPLGAISNALQLLKVRAGGDQRLAPRSLEIIERQVGQQRHMLDDLLNVSRIARGKVTLQSILLDLGQLVHDVVEDHRSALEGAGLTLQRDLPPHPVWVMGDPTRLAQVLGNLLHNASKFTDPGGGVTVRLTVNPGSGRAALSVRDTGIGIEPELIPHLFEAFTQAERTLARSRGGLGLGLALVKGLVELHGGTITARSPGPGQGAEFGVELPVSGAPSRRERLLSSSSRHSHVRRILIVEDNPDAAESLRDLLEAMGSTVAVACSGPEGVELAGQLAPELVLCDLGLPGMNGYEVARALRRHPATARARLIAVSGYGQEEDKRSALDAGFDAHLTKPIEAAELQQLLEPAPR